MHDELAEDRGERSVGQFSEEVSRGERFAFGENWRRFLVVLNDERIAEAEKSLRDFLEVAGLDRKSFLDAGSGSGLFSLVARRLGARVRSFDYDPDSVACTKELRRRYFSNDPEWQIERGSVLDQEYLSSLGRFDVVYSWGVLHHTGAMWQAMANVAGLVVSGGHLFISIYNDQGRRSDRWRRVKKVYCSSWPGRAIVLSAFVPLLILKSLVMDLRLGNAPWRRYVEYEKSRGMSLFRDWIDWLGGYPFEVATPEEVFDFCRQRGFTLQRLTTNGGGEGCNQFVFRKE